ncbi:unnamed protein product [Gordionus sp. m RMFG-2023]|uniref:uncharacterized protein LOC135928204 n=1 Tax=Gordionus sp. m RMFG-2023 TaxID=3053472 RepID=UPI0030DF5284
MERNWIRLLFVGSENFIPLYFQYNHDHATYTILITDFLSLYKERLNNDVLLKRFKKLNPFLKISDLQVFQEIKKTLVIEKNDSKDQPKIKVLFSDKSNELLKEDIKIQITANLSSNDKSIYIPFNWDFIVKECSRIEFGAYVSLPLIVTANECLNLYNVFCSQTNLQNLSTDDFITSDRGDGVDKDMVSKNAWKKIEKSPRKRIRAALTPVSLKELFVALKRKLLPTTPSSSTSVKASNTDSSDSDSYNPTLTRVEIKDRKYYVHRAGDALKGEEKSKRKVVKNSSNLTNETQNRILSLLNQNKEPVTSVGGFFNSKDINCVYKDVCKIFTAPDNLKDLNKLTIFFDHSFRNFSEESLNIENPQDGKKISKDKKLATTESYPETDSGDRDSEVSSTFDGDSDRFEMNEKDMEKEKKLMKRRQKMLKEVLEIDKKRQEIKHLAKIKREKEQQKNFQL